jgi:hypothetical protein
VGAECGKDAQGHCAAPLDRLFRWRCQPVERPTAVVLLSTLEGTRAADGFLDNDAFVFVDRVTLVVVFARTRTVGSVRQMAGRVRL